VSRFAWITGSRKATIALGTVVSIVGVRLLVRLGFNADEANNLTGALTTIGAAWIAGVAIEDHGKSTSAPAAPPASNDVQTPADAGEKES
jgi:hypothetical protein